MMSIRALAFAAAALSAACESSTVEQEQRHDRQRLAQEQAEDRQDLAQRHRAERKEARQDAREDLRGETTDVREDRLRVADRERDLAALMGQGCADVPVAQLEACPFDRDDVSSVHDVAGGVRVRLTALAGSEATIRRNVDCYRARGEIEAAARPTAPEPATAVPVRDRTPVPMAPLRRLHGPALPLGRDAVCLFDMPDLDVDVSVDGSSVDVTLTVPDGPNALELRKRAHDIADRRGASLR